jgi:hypothetical protein
MRVLIRSSINERIKHNADAADKNIICASKHNVNETDVAGSNLLFNAANLLFCIANVATLAQHWQRITFAVPPRYYLQAGVATIHWS